MTIAHFIYNETGAIIGSDGWFQEILFYVTGTLNLTVETRQVTQEKYLFSSPLFGWDGKYQGRRVIGLPFRQ